MQVEDTLPDLWIFHVTVAVAFEEFLMWIYGDTHTKKTSIVLFWPQLYFNKAHVLALEYKTIIEKVREVGGGGSGCGPGRNIFWYLVIKNSFGLKRQIFKPSVNLTSSEAKPPWAVIKRWLFKSDSILKIGYSAHTVLLHGLFLYSVWAPVGAYTLCESTDTEILLQLQKCRFIITFNSVHKTFVFHFSVNSPHTLPIIVWDSLNFIKLDI